MLPPESDEWDLDPDFASYLHGTWKSDWELTKAHLIEDCRLTDQEVEGYGRLMGKMTAQYIGLRAIFTMPEIKYTRDGKVHVLDGWKNEEIMNVIGRTNWQIAILSKSDVPLIKDSISIITFVSRDIYWVYMGNSGTTGLHVREYFKRVGVNSD